MSELLILSGKLRGKKIVLPDHEVFVGRDEGCQIRLASSDISRRHCALRPTPDGLAVRDLESQNGTYVNDAPISHEVLLKPGDRVRVGPIEFQVPGKKPAASQPAVRRPIAAGAQADVPDSASDDDIAAWLTEEGADGPVHTGDTTVIQRYEPPAAKTVQEEPASRPAPAAAPLEARPERKRFKTVADEAADIIRRHWETARTREQAGR